MKLPHKNGSSRLLIVDDEPEIRNLLRLFFDAKGYSVDTACSGNEALSLMNVEKPDIVLMDIGLPGMDGLEVLQNIREKDQETPIIMVTGVNDTDTAVSAMKSGAFDYVTKPIDLKLLEVDVEKAMEKGKLTKAGREYRENLERKVRNSTDALTGTMAELEEAHETIKEAHLDTIYRLSLASEFRNKETASHLKRMSEYSVIIARGMGWNDEEVENMRVASIMHDIGKIGIPDQILLKPGKLTEEEFEVIKKHPKIGYEILVGSDSKFLRIAQEIVLTHHEKWDGSGYCIGLKEDEIPLSGRIVAVADVFDAVTTPRVYKAAFSNGEAYKIISEGSGRHFDPEVVKAFFSCKNAIEKAQKNYSDDVWQKVFSLPDDSDTITLGANRTLNDWIGVFKN